MCSKIIVMMHTPAERFRGTVVATFSLSFVLLAGTAGLSAQTTSMRIVHVSVTDSLQRFVTGLDQDHFELVEAGSRRVITNFSGTDSPIAIAIVSDAPVPAVSKFNGPEDELIQTKSLSDALRQLSASRTPRKALVITTATPASQVIPSGIPIARVDPANVLKAVVELRNQYLLQFESPAPSATLQIVLNAPRGLPVLKLHWN